MWRYLNFLRICSTTITLSLQESAIRAEAAVMEFIYNIFVVLHFIGMAGLVGGLLVGVGAKPRTLNKMTLHSGLLVLLAGIFLIIVNSIQRASDPSIALLDHGKVGVKLLVVVAILVIGFKNLKSFDVPKKSYMAMLTLALANILIAVFW